MQDANREIAETPAASQLPAVELLAVQETSPAKDHLIRYVEDSDFQRHLAEVVIKHDRLLSKLAE